MKNKPSRFGIYHMLKKHDLYSGKCDKFHCDLINSLQYTFYFDISWSHDSNLFKIKRELRKAQKHLWCIRLNLNIVLFQWRVRKEAMMGLAQLYKKYCLHHEAGKESALKISWIKDKLLHIYYQNSIDDK